MQRILSILEERRLLELIHSGDQEARIKMIECNTGLARKVTNSVWKNIERFFPETDIQELDVDKETIEQEAYLGLITAVDRFDINRQNKFSSFACEVIKRSIENYLKDSCRIVRVPAHKHWDNNGLRKVVFFQKIVDSQNQTRIRRAYLEDDTDVFNWEEEFLNELENFCIDPIKLEPEEFELLGLKIDLVRKVKAMKKTPKCKKKLLILIGLIFNGEYNEAEIGKKIGVCRERARQMIAELTNSF